MKKITWTNGGIEYEIVGSFGCWAKSKETVTVQKGDVRFIAGELMYAYIIQRASFFNFKDGRDTVSWVSIREKADAEEIRKWKAWLVP